MNAILNTLKLIQIETKDTLYFPPETGPLMLQIVLNRLRPENRLDWLIKRELSGLAGKLAVMKLFGLPTDSLNNLPILVKTTGEKEVFRFTHPKATESNDRQPILFVKKLDFKEQGLRVQLIGVSEYSLIKPFLKSEQRYLSIRLNTLIKENLLRHPYKPQDHRKNTI